MSKHTNSHRSVRAGVFGLLVVASLAFGASGAAAASGRTTEPVTWLFDPGTPIGSSTLVRTDSGISAVFHSSGVPKGSAVTLWFIVFNNPAACHSHPCGLADLLFNLDAKGDFLVGDGTVVGGTGTVTMAGHLAVGDTRNSAFPEIGMPDRPIGLSNPWGAQVSLLLHSHGPAVPGQTLKSQISSFTGGCSVFQGNLELPGSGLADGPEDIPDAVGECSTLQGSVHL